LFAGNNAGAKKWIFLKLEKYDFSIITPKSLPMVFFKLYHSKEREESYKKSQYF